MTVTVHPLSRCRLRLTGGHWDFERRRAAEIGRHWQAARARKPAMWDGRVLMMARHRLAGGALEGDLVDVAYSSYHAWKSWDFADDDVVNCFGSAVLATADGALVYGVMAPGTSNGGLIYPVAGMLDHGDVADDGTIDIYAATARELEEETGIGIASCRRAGQFAVRERGLLSVAQVLRVDWDADALAGRIRDFLAADADPELQDVVVLRRPADLDPDRSFGFARRIAELVLGEE